jgi:hypothetical protein
MKKLLLLLIASLLMPLSIGVSQTLMDYVSATRGDTLVIKDYTAMGGVQNSLYQVLYLDSVSVPAGRVYMLTSNGYYPLVNNPSPRRATVIVGEDPTLLVQNTNAGAAPPLICGASWTGGSNTGSMNYTYDVTVKNCNIDPSDAAGDKGWNFFSAQTDNCKLTLENDLFERTLWVYFATGSPGQKYFLRNCYFVNMNGLACRRNGGVMDSFGFMDTLWVENCTHVMAEGSMYKFRGNPFNRVVFNHNTFINCSGLMFMDWGLQVKMSMTNNIFVNCNVQGYSGLTSIDIGEQDLDGQPMGLINMHTFPADTSFNRWRSLPRQYLWENNVAYWDPKLTNATDGVIATLNTNHTNGVSAWKDQMIVMNQRTTAMFNDNTTYPNLTSRNTYTVFPNFTSPQNLFTTALDNLKAFSIGTCDTGSTDIMPDWRIHSTGQTNFLYPDWPIPVNLSYSDATLMTGGTGGFPVGDLNWFAARKTQWLAQRTAEYAAIDNELHSASSVGDVSNLPGKFELVQNYPNPFNPTTTISFSLPHAANATLKVFNTLGEEVATLVNELTTAGSHTVQFNATGLASGVYFYRLTSDDLTQSMKMLLVK